jgi:hypothetical protein
MTSLPIDMRVVAQARLFRDVMRAYVPYPGEESRGTLKANTYNGGFQTSGTVLVLMRLGGFDHVNSDDISVST